LAGGDLSAGVAAVKEIGVLTGERVERSEVGAPGEFETMTDDELKRALIERMARLGLTDVGDIGGEDSQLKV
jgi:hypothetical protein